MKKELRVGDLVKVNDSIKEYMFADFLHMKKGDVLQVERIHNEAKLRVLSGDGDSHLKIGKGYELSDGKCYFEKWLDFVEKDKTVDEDKQTFSLSDLKDGQLVEVRSGATFIKFGQMLIEVSDAHFLQLNEYSDDLTFNNNRKDKIKNSRYDIVGVYNSNDAKHIVSVHGENSLAAQLISKDDRRKSLKRVW